MSSKSKSKSKSNYEYWDQFDREEDGLGEGEESREQSFDAKLIETIKNEPNLYRLITASLCPQLYGQEVVKSALVLALFGGTDKHDKQCRLMQIRGQTHILLFGNHGSSKDLLLKSVHSIAPKAKYLCANTAAINTMTAVLAKDKHKKYYFEKGSLISSTSEICCIDDFESMNSTTLQAINEVMETQTVSVYKNGMFGEFSAKTSIIGAVNPLNGCYDLSLNVWQNTKINKSILSKFDLIFLLDDSPDEELDSKLSKAILDSSKHLPKTVLNRTNRFCSQTLNTNANDSKLKLKLIFGFEDEEPDLIPHELLKTYVNYAQQYIHPVLSGEARALLIQFCTEIGNSEISKSKTRDLETLCRLTEARARLELRPMATEEDVRDVIDIVKHSIGKELIAFPNDLYFSQTFNRKSSKTQKTRNLLNALKLFSQQNQQNVFTIDTIVDICSSFRIPFDSKEDILDAIDRLNIDSALLKNGSNYKLI